MADAEIDSEEAVLARLSRFALCVAPTSHHAFSALEAVCPLPVAVGENGLREAFRGLLSRLGRGVSSSPEPRQAANSLVARFSVLPYYQRVAFALVVIEEFTLANAAEIMGLGEDDVRNLLLSARDCLFAENWSGPADA